MSRDVKLEYGSLFDEKMVFDVSLAPQRSGTLLMMDKYRSNGITFLKHYVINSTVAIGGVPIEIKNTKQRNKAEQFWGASSVEDLYLAARELAEEIWGIDDDGIEMPSFPCVGCKNISEHLIRVSDMEISRDKESVVEVELFEPFKIGDHEVHKIFLKPETTRHAEGIFQHYNAPQEHKLRQIAGQIFFPNDNKLVVDYGDIERFHPRDRKKIERAANSFTIVNSMFDKPCTKCGIVGKVVADITAFF